MSCVCLGYLKLVDLPFSFRQRIREELSLAKVTKARHLAVAGDGIFVQILSKWQQLVPRCRALQWDHLVGVQCTQHHQVGIEVDYGLRLSQCLH